MLTPATISAVNTLYQHGIIDIETRQKYLSMLRDWEHTLEYELWNARENVNAVIEAETKELAEATLAATIF